jgi:hypothetical protein
MNMRLVWALAGLLLVAGGAARIAEAAPLRVVESRLFQAVKYDGATRTLVLVFHSGSAYAFRDVPRRVYDDFLRIVNRGEYFNRNIRKVYRCERLDRYPDGWCARD